MSEKIKDGYAGGVYPTGESHDKFQPTNDGRLGVTGKFNLLVDEVGQITNLQTQTKTTVVDAINEVNTGTVGSVKLNSAPQTLVGSYTFGTTPNTSDDVTFNHDVIFEGNVRFAGGVGNTLELDNNYISLGDSTSVTPVGDGGIILERGNNLEDAQLLWDESDLKWKLKSASTSYSTIIHEDSVNSNALSYIKTGDLNAPDIEVISNTPFVRLNRSNAGTNDKTWSINNSTTNGNLIVQAIGDNGTSTTKAYEVNRSGVSITSHQFYTGNTERLKIDNTNVTSSIPIKVDSIVESTTDNGITIDQLKIKDTSIVSGSNTMTNFTNAATIINPSSIDLDFTVNGNGTQALTVDAGASQIYSRYNTYFDQGVFVDTITQRNTSGVTFNSIANFPSNIDVTNVLPTIRINESDRGTDEKEWSIRSSGSQFQVNAVNDARSSIKPAYTINRTSTTNNPSVHDMYVGDNVAFKLTSTGVTLGESVTSSDKQLNLNVKDGFKYSVFFRQDNIIRGEIAYSDLTDRLNIGRYATVGGAFIGGLLMSETDVTVSGLDLIVNNNLNANTINPRTGTTTTLSNNVNVTGTLATNGGKLVFGTIASQGDRIEFNDSTNEFTFLEDNTVNNSIVSSGSVKLSKTTAPLNTKTTTATINTNGEYVIASISDDGTSTSNIFKNTKSGINTTGQQFYINNNIELSLNTSSLTLGSGSVDSNISQVVNSKAGFDSGYNITQGGALKGILRFTNSSNKLDINRYANVGGAYVGGLSISETNILVDNLSLDVETTIKVDTINEFTNNNGITIDGVVIKDNSVTTITDVKTNTINERTSNSGVTIDGVLIKDNSITTSTDVKTNTINERTTDSGVTIDNVLLKDGNITIAGGGVIQSSTAINVVIDSDNNQTDAYFGIYNNSLINSNALMTVSENGGINLYSKTDTSIAIIDAGTTNVNANPLITFNRASSPGQPVTQMGLIGSSSTSNEDFYVQSTTNGVLALLSNTGVDVHLDNDNNGSSTFNILNGTDNVIFTVNESGTVNTNDVISGNLTATINAAVYGNLAVNGNGSIGSVTTNSIDLNGSMTSSNGQVASAHATINGTGIPTLRKGYNIASVTRLGTGAYRINFTTPFSDNDYSFSLNSLNLGAVRQYFVATVRATAVATNYIDIQVLGDNGGAWNALDLDRISVVIFANQ